jgi:predicted aconitase with swiveling domain
VLLEAVRARTSPAAVLTRGRDRFLALASIVAGELYGRSYPVVALTDEDFERLRRGGWARIGQDGRVDLL